MLAGGLEEVLCALPRSRAAPQRFQVSLHGAWYLTCFCSRWFSWFNKICGEETLWPLRKSFRMLTEAGVELVVRLWRESVLACLVFYGCHVRFARIRTKRAPGRASEGAKSRLGA